MSGALKGMRVLDLSAVVMAPLAARILGDMGADVIKVESPEGDSVRKIGPMRNPGMGPMYLHVNRNKRSIALDLKSSDGKAALHRLIKDADVLLYNIRPQAMARLGLAYEACRAINPGLIYVSACGFGERGPYAGRPAFDDLIQGLCAMPSLFARSSQGVPRYIPLSMVDRYMGQAVASAVLGAYVHKLNTGEGQQIEVPMFETMAECVLSDHSAGETFEPALGPPGYPRYLALERHPYETRDGHICLAMYTDQHWKNFFELIGSDLFDTDPRFNNLTSRTAHASSIHQFLEQQLRHRSTAEWLRAFEQADIPSNRLHSLESLAEDEHLQAVGFFDHSEHPSEGRLRTINPAARWSGTPLTVRRHAPRTGEHTREVLRELGYDEAAISAMLAAGSAVEPQA
ncbi:MAG: CoA transferase [Burkholderiaceae bacterium]|nr:CoA transferase [Burkholderiaceae bacterium]